MKEAVEKKRARRKQETGEEAGPVVIRNSKPRAVGFILRPLLRVIRGGKKD